MNKRIGGALLVIEDNGRVEALTKIISSHSSMILGRQGIPLRDRQMSVISLVLEGTTDDIGSLAGKLGNLPGIRVKTVLVT